jgi:hypothetical protein
VHEEKDARRERWRKKRTQEVKGERREGCRKSGMQEEKVYKEKDAGREGRRKRRVHSQKDAGNCTMKNYVIRSPQFLESRVGLFLRMPLSIWPSGITAPLILTSALDGDV